MTITSYIHQMVKEHAIEKIWCFLSFSWIYCTFKMSKGLQLWCFVFLKSTCWNYLDCYMIHNWQANQGPYRQSCGLSSSLVWMWDLDHKESWVPNWCFRTMVLEKTWESLGLQGNQSWIFIGRTDGKAEAPILWPPDAKNWLIGKDPDAGGISRKDGGQEEKGVTEDELFGWHKFNGYEFEQTLGDSAGQGSLACCSSRGRKE